MAGIAGNLREIQHLPEAGSGLGDPSAAAPQASAATRATHVPRPRIASCQQPASRQRRRASASGGTAACASDPTTRIGEALEILDDPRLAEIASP